MVISTKVAVVANMKRSQNLNMKTNMTQDHKVSMTSTTNTTNMTSMTNTTISMKISMTISTISMISMINMIVTTHTIREIRKVRRPKMKIPIIHDLSIKYSKNIPLLM